MDSPSSPRSLVRKVHDDLPEAAPSSIISESSMMSMLHESELIREHKSYVIGCIHFTQYVGAYNPDEKHRDETTVDRPTNSENGT